MKKMLNHNLCFIPIFTLLVTMATSGYCKAYVEPEGNFGFEIGPYQSGLQAAPYDFNRGNKKQ